MSNLNNTIDDILLFKQIKSDVLLSAMRLVIIILHIHSGIRQYRKSSVQ